MAGTGVPFHHVAFRVADLDASIRWYGEAFGAREVFRMVNDVGAPNLVYLEFAPGQNIELFPNGKNRIEEPAQSIGYRHLCLRVDDIHATLEHLAGMGVTPRNPANTVRIRPAGQTGGASAARTYTRAAEGTVMVTLAFIADPDGNQIELLEIPPESPLYD
ncbi:MAG: VOC family protein [Chloroflexi bacterium]|nr:VOC family protein [Chloroflexota bacterium]